MLTALSQASKAMNAARMAKRRAERERLAFLEVEVKRLQTELDKLQSKDKPTES